MSLRMAHRCPLSVYAWEERNGKYYKPEGARDSHLVKAEFVDKDNQIWIKDTYKPFIKVLEANTDFEFSMYWTIKKFSPEEQLNNAQKDFISIILSYVSNLLKQLYKVAGQVVGAIFSKKS